MKYGIRICLLGVLSILVSQRGAVAQFDALKKLAQGATTSVKQIAHFQIKGLLAETPSNTPSLFGSEVPSSLKTLLERFKKARLDSDVVAVVVDLQAASLGFGQLQEIHQSLRKFSAVDKEVYIHADSLTTGTYTVATAASHISMVPTGTLQLIGLYGETPYIRGTLDKLGCIADFEHCGDYKTGPEIYMRTGPSEESKKMSKRLLDAMYGELVALIATGRDVSEDKVRALIDDGPYDAADALKAGLIDSVRHRQEFIEEIKKRHGSNVQIVTDYGKRDLFDIPDDNIFALFDFVMKMINPTPKVYTEPSVAIVYVEGMIQSGKAETSPFGRVSGAFSTTIRRALDRAAQDKSVKAVVLRIDSPGGSALASEIMLNAAKRVSARKPLIVSMGNVAASGGYYVTCSAETIFADSGTITGSIGVFGGKIVTTGAWDKLGVHWYAQQRGKMAGLLSSASQFNDEERAKIVEYMNAIYDVFKGHVTASRGKHLTKPIDEIAGGRVYTGAEARELGLVDRIGGLNDAIKFAAKRAGLGEYDIRVIPEPPSIFDMFGVSGSDEGYTQTGFRSKRSMANLPTIATILATLSAVDPIRARAMLEAIAGLDIVRSEGVLMMAPSIPVIR